MRNSKNIVIIGAGFGGLQTALTLEKKLRDQAEWMIYLIDSKDFHVYKALLYEVATGYFEEETPKCEGILRRGVCLPIEDIKEILGQKHIKFINKFVGAVDLANQTVSLKDGTVLDYGYLVMASGSEVEYFNIPGLKENSIPLRGIDDALDIRRKTIELCNAAGKQKMAKPLQFVIGGGGFTGVELACEMIGFLKRLSVKHGMPSEHQNITIIEATNQILPGIDPAVVDLALKRLKDLGINTKLGDPVVEVLPNQIKLKSGAVMPSDLFIWSGGVRASALSSSLSGIEMDKKGRAVVNEMLQMKGKQKEFAIGDDANYLDAKTGFPLPPTAQIAVQEAETVAHNIYRDINGQPMEPFSSHFKGFVVPMGGKYAIAALKKGYYTGYIGYMIRKWDDLSYFLKIMPPGRAFQYWMHGAMVYRHND